jgi:putative glutamine amidotransferase
MIDAATQEKISPRRTQRSRRTEVRRISIFGLSSAASVFSVVDLSSAPREEAGGLCYRARKVTKMRIAISVAEKEKAKGAQSPYYQAMLMAGAEASEIELVAASDAPHVRADHYDGIVFAGGEDVDPCYYGEGKQHENVHDHRRRDEFEFALLGGALARRAPILGICRGLQMINVKFGGTLYQDLKEDAAPQLEHRQTELGKSRQEPTHTVLVTDSESNLGTMFRGACRVNSLHHQAVKRLGRGLKVTARSEDGLVEAVESADEYPFFLAVQWHPEEMVSNSPEQREIFAQFVAKCRERAVQHETFSRGR